MPAKRTRKRTPRKSREESAQPAVPQASEVAQAEAPGPADVTTPYGEETQPPPAPEAAVAVPRGERTTRSQRSNALGALIERRFADPVSPCRSYSDLERRSGISREALSRYVTARPDRRRAPTIDTLVAIAGAMHLGLEPVCRAAALAARGYTLPEENLMRDREEALRPLIAPLSNEQFAALVELVRLMNPPE